MANFRRDNWISVHSFQKLDESLYPLRIGDFGYSRVEIVTAMLRTRGYGYITLMLNACLTLLLSNKSWFGTVFILTLQANYPQHCCLVFQNIFSTDWNSIFADRKPK